MNLIMSNWPKLYGGGWVVGVGVGVCVDIGVGVGVAGEF